MKTPRLSRGFTLTAILGIRSTPRHDRLHFLLVDVEVGGDALDVIMFFERFHEPQHLRRLVPSVLCSFEVPSRLRRNQE